MLLLDEVTSALDPELVAGVLDVLRDIAHSTDITMLCVTHEMNFARDISDRVLMFDSGQVIEAGAPEKIFSEPEQPRTREFLSACCDVGKLIEAPPGTAAVHDHGICQCDGPLLRGPNHATKFVNSHSPSSP